MPKARHRYTAYQADYVITFLKIAFMTITVSALHIYPVKSLAGIALSACGVTAQGFKFDRRFMLVNAAHVFITQRENPKLATIWADVIGDEIELSAPDMPTLRFPVSPPAQATFSVQLFEDQAPTRGQPVSAAADAWLSRYLESEITLVYMPESVARYCSDKYAKNNEIVSFADGYPLLVTTEASLADLNARIALTGGAAIPMNRFRPNVVLRGAAPWAEDGWLNRTFSIGDTTFQAVKPCGRCVITTPDQATGDVRGAEPLQPLATFRMVDERVIFGMNVVPVKLGTVRVGDVFRLG